MAAYPDPEAFGLSLAAYLQGTLEEHRMAPVEGPLWTLLLLPEDLTPVPLLGLGNAGGAILPFVCAPTM